MQDHYQIGRWRIDLNVGEPLTAKEIRVPKLTCEQAWGELDSQSRLLSAAVTTRNRQGIVKCNLEIGRLIGVLVAEDERLDSQAEKRP